MSASNVKSVPVTVVIPVYNAERFIREALDSVRAQTMQPAEVLVVDDGSTDRSGVIAEAWGARVLRQQNRGNSSARNAAIRATSQPWIAFLDADDVWEPQKLEYQWIAVQRCPGVGAVFTDFTEFDSRGTIGKSFLSSRANNYQAIHRTEVAPGVVRCDEESLRARFLEGNFIAPSTLLVRRDLLLQVGLFNATLNYLEDRELCLRLLRVSTMAGVERPLVRSRIHDSNWSGDALKMVQGAIAVAELIFANPEKYPHGAVARYRKDLPSFYLNAGRLADERNETKRARGYYQRAWQVGGELRPLVLALLSHFPHPIRQVAKTSVRRFTAPRNGTPGITTRPTPASS
jgi:glycosyltransferase involved in cell wall biosynthesis